MDVLDTTAGEGRFAVRLSVVGTGGKGLCAALMGGESPHVGAVVLGVPSPKLEGEGTTCDISQICLPGHKDAVAAAKAARILALGTGEPVSVTCGVHVDAADSQDIARLVSNCEEAARLWLDRYEAR